MVNSADLSYTGLTPQRFAVYGAYAEAIYRIGAYAPWGDEEIS